METVYKIKNKPGSQVSHASIEISYKIAPTRQIYEFGYAYHVNYTVLLHNQPYIASIGGTSPASGAWVDNVHHLDQHILLV